MAEICFNPEFGESRDSRGVEDGCVVEASRTSDVNLFVVGSPFLDSVLQNGLNGDKSRRFAGFRKSMTRCRGRRAICHLVYDCA